MYILGNPFNKKICARNKNL